MSISSVCEEGILPFVVVFRLLAICTSGFLGSVVMHSAPARWQFLHVGICSSHRTFRERQRLQACDNLFRFRWSGVAVICPSILRRFPGDQQLILTIYRQFVKWEGLLEFCGFFFPSFLVRGIEKSVEQSFA